MASRMRDARTHGRPDVVRLSYSCLMSIYTTVCNKRKLALTEAHRMSLQCAYKTSVEYAKHWKNVAAATKVFQKSQ